MPLTSENLILEDAEKRNYAVPGLFPFDLNFIKPIIEAAEEEQSPIIILQGPELTRLFGTEIFTCALKTAAHHASVPVCLSLDHGVKTDRHIINDVITGIRNGWGSIMVDGSLLPYEDNLSITKSMAEICHAANVSCCGALGEVRRFFPAFNQTFTEDFTVPEEVMTDPDQAKDFVEKTGIDSLAVSIGQYVISLWEEDNKPIKKTARLDLERLKAIHEATHAHLILHGSSHVNEADLQESIRLGICEIKFASEYGSEWALSVREEIDLTPGLFHPMDIQKSALLKVKETIKGKMRLFNSSDKASVALRKGEKMELI